MMKLGFFTCMKYFAIINYFKPVLRQYQNVAFGDVFMQFKHTRSNHQLYSNKYAAGFSINYKTLKLSMNPNKSLACISDLKITFMTLNAVLILFFNFASN